MKTNQSYSIIRLVFLTTLLTISVFISSAATFTSSQSGDWNQSSTWGGAGVPGSADNVVIGSGHTVNINASATISQLTVSGSGAVLRLKSDSWDPTFSVTGNTYIDEGGSITDGNPYRRYTFVFNNLLIGTNTSTTNNSSFTLNQETNNNSSLTISGTLTLGGGSGSGVGSFNYTLNLYGGTNVLSIANISIASNGRYTVNPAGGSGLTYTISGDITNNSTQTNQFNNTNRAVTLSGNKYITGSAASTVSFAGNVTITNTRELRCGVTLTATATITNNGTIIGPTAGWARIVNSNAISNSSGTVGSSTTFIALSGTVSGGTVVNNGTNVLQSSSQAAECVSALITLSESTISSFAYCAGAGPSAVQSYSVSGSDLSANIVITPPSNYQISQDNTTWISSPSTITLTHSGGTVASTTIYVRLKAGLSAGDYNSELITHTSTGTAQKNVTLSGSVSSGAIITVSETVRSGFYYCEGGGPTSSLSYTVAGSCLSENITITAPSAYEVSLNNSDFFASRTLTHTAGVVGTTTVYVRMKAGLTAGAYNSDNITHTSSGATQKNVLCMGTVAKPSVALASPNQTQAGEIERNSLKNIVSAFTLSTASFDAELSSVSFTTAGSYTTSDVANFKLWFAITDNLSSATQLGSAISTSHGSGATLNFSGLTQALPVGTTRYVWITADIAVGAISSRTLSISTSDISLLCGDKTGSIAAGGTLTIVDPPVDYYYVGSGSLANVSNWGINTNGSGANPPNFTTNRQTFHIRNTASVTLDAAWTVSGTNSKIIIGDGSTAISVTIPNNQQLTTSGDAVIDVRNNATLIITHATTPRLGTVSSGSTVNYNGSGAQTVRVANYHNLTLANTRGGAAITLEEGIISVANTFTVSTLGTLNTNYTVSSTGNTFIFDGSGNQTIPVFEYNSLHTELGGTKTLAGNITVKDKLRIGAITILSAQNYTITLSGSGSIVTLIGSFYPGESTVKYTSAENATVGAMNYYNLDISENNGPRTFQTSQIISVANNFVIGSGTYTTTNSTFRFNGSVAQTSPAFSYYNLIIKNSHASGVSLNGNITVQGTLTLEAGKLVTSSYVVIVSNTQSSAVSAGTATSFVEGKLTRYLPANLLSSSAEYIFPVGKTYYYPFRLNTITTGESAPTVTVEAFSTSAGGSAGSGLTAVSTTEYWEVTKTGDYTNGRVSLTRRADEVLNFNAIGRSDTKTGAYTSLKGTKVADTRSVINSELTGFSFFVLGTRTETAVTYYSKSGAGVDLSNLANWGTNTDGTGTAPTSFNVDDATFYIRNSTTPTVLSNWTVSGYNSNVVLGNNSTAINFTIPSGITVTFQNNFTLTQNATLTIEDGGVLNVNGQIIFSAGDASRPQTINNFGEINVLGRLTQQSGSYSYINNKSTGIINLNSDYAKDQNTWFYNDGAFNITQGSFTTTNNYQNIFVNRDGATVTIDNTLAPTKIVNFNNIHLAEGVQLLQGSTFTIIHSDISITGGNGPMQVAGDLIVQDGNMNFQAGGSTLQVTEPGGLYVYDTDNSGDGVLDLSNGGISLTNNGFLYVEGLTVASGGGTAVTVTDGATMFIGNIGLYTGTNSNNLIVQGGGTLNYCGNRTSGADNMGTINSGGILNYAQGYYTTQTPGDQSDFVVSGTQQALYSNAEECRASFYAGTPYSEQLLPIQLTMLYGICVGGQVRIVWQTASETNNMYFTLYKSYDGIRYEPIADIAGAGTTTYLQNYSYSDTESSGHMVYYRLSQTDYDGTTAYSKIIAVDVCEAVTRFTFKHNSYVEVQFSNPNTENRIIITNMFGKILHSSVYTNTEKVEIDLPKERGAYIISHITPTQIVSKQFVKR